MFGVNTFAFQIQYLDVNGAIQASPMYADQHEVAVAIQYLLAEGAVIQVVYRVYEPMLSFL